MNVTFDPYEVHTHLTSNLWCFSECRYSILKASRRIEIGELASAIQLHVVRATAYAGDS